MVKVLECFPIVSSENVMVGDKLARPRANLNCENTTWTLVGSGSGQLVHGLPRTSMETSTDLHGGAINYTFFIIDSTSMEVLSVEVFMEVLSIIIGHSMEDSMEAHGALWRLVELHGG